MEVNWQVVIVYGARAVECALLATILGLFWRVYGKRYLNLWQLSWIALTVASVGTAAAMALVFLGYSASSPLRLAFTLIGQAGAFWHLVWLLAGTLELTAMPELQSAGKLTRAIRPAPRRAPSPRALRVALALAALAAVATALPWAWSASGAWPERYLMRHGLRSLFTALAGLAAAKIVWEARRRNDLPGSRFLAGALLAYGLSSLAAFSLTLYPFFTGRLLSFGSIHSYLDLIIVMTIGFAMVLLLLEQERYRSLASSGKIAFLARHDPVTGLLNRRGLLEAIEQTSGGARSTGRVALAVLAVDRYKPLSRILGNSTTETLMRSLVRRLHAAPGAPRMLARVAEDEIAVLLDEVDGEDHLHQEVESLLAAQHRPFEVEGRSLFLRLTASSVLAEEDASAEALLARAVNGLYHVQAFGVGRPSIVSEDLAEEPRKLLEMESRLREAWLNREFELFFQPTIQLSDGAFVGVEALLRWRHPHEGIKPPGVFLSTAKSAGLMPELEPWVLRQAVGLLTEWRVRGIGDLRVAVNLSAERFQQQGLVETVQATLEEFGLDPNLLELEITESAALSLARPTLDMLGRLKRLGVRIAIDDFASGYSSFGYLGVLPADTLKIDRSLVANLGRRPQDSAIAEAIISVSQKLGLAVVAEGVTSKEQSQMLSDLGCDFAQGFLYGEPRNADETFALLSAA